MKNVLITGGAGFIGCHLARDLLSRGYQVSIVDDFSRGVQDIELLKLFVTDETRLIRCDLLDRSAVLALGREYDIIFHLAAIIGVERVMTEPWNVLRANMGMLINMLDLARLQLGLARFLFASTSEVYAGTLQYGHLPVPTPETVPLTISDLNHPRTSYMLSKIYGEALCQHAGIPFTIFRPHNIYGPRMGMAHVIPEQLRKAHQTPEGGRVDVFSVDHTRSFCFIDDAVEMLVRMMERENCMGKTLNLGTQTPELTMWQLVEMCHRAMHKKLQIIPRPATSGSPARRAPDMSLTSQLTGYQAQVTPEEGITRTYNWYHKHVFNGNDVCAQ